MRGGFSSGNKGKVLFVPSHSNPWNDYSELIKNSISKFKECYGKISVMLGVEDYDRFSSTKDDNISYFKGAGVHDIGSFYRLAEIFESHEYVITDTVGSHICYALHCGAKVGIDKNLFESSQITNLSLDTPNNRKLSQFPDYKNFLNVCSLDYLESRFPKITIDGSLPIYDIPPPIAYEKPHTIATELGWDITYNCEKTKDFKV